MLRPKILRRHWVSSILTISALLIWVYTSYSERKTSPVDVYQVQHTLLRQPFQWQPKLHDTESNVSSAVKCRNSVQGRQYIVDERGYVCEREDLTGSGCCEVKTTKSTRYNCSTCKTNSCCILYEHCVSCCLQPEKSSKLQDQVEMCSVEILDICQKPLLQRILENARDTVDKLFVSVSDHFELCLAKCRTSSKSVQHENSYRDPKAKHCYGEDPPDLQLVVT